ncbi:hypothetical protein [Pseudomonas sp. OTU5201]|uniref:hypothetical protein n=1 Tax=Pseudomonas sp. OTU5201 TaxID=3043850 RepID=UPI00313ACB83
MDLFNGVPPVDALSILQNITNEDFQKSTKSQGLSRARAGLLLEIIRRKRKVNFYLGVDIQRYALKFLLPDFYADLSLGNHIYSTSELYDYDPPKNGQNAIKHGLSFREVVSYSSQFGTLLVPCPDNNNGTRCVIFSDLDAGIDGENLELPISGMAGKIYTMSVAQQGSGKFRFISSRMLSQNSYKEIMRRAFKNIYQDDPVAKDAFVKRCIEIVEQQLFK